MNGLNVDARTYQPINNYGVIGDCRSVVLVAPDGSVDWGCLPDFDSPAIFCRLLDAESGGYFQIAPTDDTIPGQQRYLTGSNVLQTRFTSIAGELALTDFMPVKTLSARSQQEMHATAEEDARHCLVRIVECTRGEMAVTMTLKATPHYAATASTVTFVSENTGAVISGGEQHLALSIVGSQQLPSFFITVEQGAEDMHPVVIAKATLHRGELLIFAVGMVRTAESARMLAEHTSQPCEFEGSLAHTLECWRAWSARNTYQGPYAAWVQRAPLSPRPPRLSPKSWAGCATGITAIPGCAMPPSRSTRSAHLVTPRRCAPSRTG